MPLYTLPPKDELIKQIKAFMRETGFSEQRLADETGLSQPVISRILMGERELRYEEAKKIVDCLTSKLSSIPPKMRASDVATKGENLMKVHVEENLSDVAKMMFEKGYSQAPVYENEMIKGIITEKSFIELLLTPEKDLRKLKVKDAPIEDAPRYSPETPLQNIAKALLDYYSILIEEDGRVKGIITRADLLKLFF